jgi:hypothetical protein
VPLSPSPSFPSIFGQASAGIHHFLEIAAFFFPQIKTEKIRFFREHQREPADGVNLDGKIFRRTIQDMPARFPVPG